MGVACGDRVASRRGVSLVLKVFPLSSDSHEAGRWLDLLEPTESERAEAERLTGLSLPTREHLSEIESSSRLRQRDGVLTMSTPMIALVGSMPRGLKPIGFVLSRKSLVTIRFSPLSAFDEVESQFVGVGDDSAEPPASSLETFVRLCDEMVDRMADALEGLAAALNELSGEVFAIEDTEAKTPDRTNGDLRDRLRLVGRLGDRASNTRDALLGLGRILAYVEGAAKDWEDARFEGRIASLRQDVVSLNDYEVHLSDKVQFLLDALVGMIGIAQNDIFKILTIVSIVGIPPTLVASIYGMNFKIMPELNWSLGYPWGLALIVTSAIVPLVWFKRRGWF